MKRPSYFLRLLAALAIVSSTLAVTAVTAFASPPPSGSPPAYYDGGGWLPLVGTIESDYACDILPPTGICDGFEAFADGAHEVYFAAVGNGEDFGLGPAQTSITVQNIDWLDAYIFIRVGQAGGGFSQWGIAYLSAGASKTFTAAQLGIPEGEVRPVVVQGFHYIGDFTFCGDGDLNGDGDCEDDDVPQPGGGTDDEYYTTVFQVRPVFMAGVAKQAVEGANLPFTTPADTSVSGYNAISGREVGRFDQMYFPIVQTNCGPGGCWNSILRISNVHGINNAAITVRFFPADDGSGSLATGFQLQSLVNYGGTWSINLADWVPDGWVGSAHVYTDGAAIGIVDRYKVGTDMWITNTASNAEAEAFWQFPGGPSNAPYVLFAPDVRTDWNGWNTGINVANTVEFDNHVWIQYFGSNGNAPLALDRELHAHGMTYFYNPSQPSEDDCEQPATDVPGCEFIGGAVILSEEPVAVAVDGVKYFGNDANVGQAFTYAATGNVYTDQAAPLVQKGNPATGMGATSGINFLNPNSGATVVTTWWINPSGFNASNFASSIVWVPGFATGFVYTMFHSNLPNGFYGSAIVTSDLPIAATTANVDYQVQGDGTVVWNLYNPCGFFRFSGYPGDEPDCVYQAPVEPSPEPVSATITKVVTCPTCDLDFDFIPASSDPDESDVVEGALVTFEGTDTSGFAHNGSGLTNDLGEVVFAVPAGTYEINIVSLPAGYVLGTDTPDEVTVAVGDAVTVYNEVAQEPLTGEGLLTKEIDLSGFDIGDPGDEFHLLSEIIFCDASLVTADNAADLTTSGECDDTFDDAAVAHGGFDNLFDTITTTFEFNAVVNAGAYYICLTTVVEGDFDGDPLTPDVALVNDYMCEGPYYVFDGEETFVSNDFVAQSEGTLDVLVEAGDGTTDLEGIEVCLYEYDGAAPGGLGALIACEDTNADGEADFDNVPFGTYAVTARGSEGDIGGTPYEDQTAVIDYNPAEDLALGNELDDDLAANEDFADVYFSLEENII